MAAQVASHPKAGNATGDNPLEDVFAHQISDVLSGPGKQIDDGQTAPHDRLRPPDANSSSDHGKDACDDVPKKIVRVRTTGVSKTK